MTGCKIIDFCAQKLIEIVGIHSVEVECKAWHKSMYMYQYIYYIRLRHHYIRLLYPCVSAFDKKLFVAMSAVCANSILMWTRPKLRHISSLINRSCFFSFTLFLHLFFLFLSHLFYRPFSRSTLVTLTTLSLTVMIKWCSTDG